MRETANYDCPHKTEVRKASFDIVETILRRPAKVYAGLVGPQALCVQHAKNRHVIDGGTRVIAFECLPERYDPTQQSLRRIGVRSEVVSGDAKTINKWRKIGEPIDLVNLDLEESLNLGVMRLLEDLQDCLADEAVLMITLTDYIRKTKNFNAAFHSLLAKRPDIKKAHAENRRKMIDDGTCPEKSYAADYMVLINMALARFKVKFELVNCYADNNAMVSFVVRLNRLRKSRPVPGSSDIVAFMNAPAISPVAKKRSSPSRAVKKVKNTVTQHKTTRVMNRLLTMSEALRSKLHAGVATETEAAMCREMAKSISLLTASP